MILVEFTLGEVGLHKEVWSEDTLDHEQGQKSCRNLGEGGYRHLDTYLFNKFIERTIPNR